MLAYERDNQHQDEAEDPENEHEPQEQGLHETDPESEADVSDFSSYGTYKLSKLKGNFGSGLGHSNDAKGLLQLSAQGSLKLGLNPDWLHTRQEPDLLYYSGLLKRNFS